MVVFLSLQLSISTWHSQCAPHQPSWPPEQLDRPYALDLELRLQGWLLLCELLLGLTARSHYPWESISTLLGQIFHPAHLNFLSIFLHDSCDIPTAMVNFQRQDPSFFQFYYTLFHIFWGACCTFTPAPWRPFCIASYSNFQHLNICLWWFSQCIWSYRVQIYDLSAFYE